MTCTDWPLSLPALQVAEQLQDPAEARILVLYPVLPQNLHKFALITIF
jgi:hypothetical protein